MGLTIPAVPLRESLPLHCGVKSSLTCVYEGSLVSLTSLCSPQRLCSAHFKNGYLAKTCTAMRLYVPCSAQPAPGDNPSPVFLQKPSAPMASHPAVQASAGPGCKQQPNTFRSSHHRGNQRSALIALTLLLPWKLAKHGS